MRTQGKCSFCDDSGCCPKDLDHNALPQWLFYGLHRRRKNTHVLSLLLFCSADPCGRHHQEHTGVWDRAGGGYRPHITGYGLLSGSWTPLHHVWEAGKKLHQSMVLWKLLAWSQYGRQNCMWSSENEHSYYQDVLHCWSHDFSCLENITFIYQCNFWGARDKKIRG